MEVERALSKPVMSYNEALLEREKLLQSTKADNPLVTQINKQVNHLRKNVYLSIENAKQTLDLTLEDLRGKEKLILDKMGKFRLWNVSILISAVSRK